MGNKWILGVALLVVLLGGLWYLGVIPAEGASSAMDITFYDADGNEIGKATTGGLALGIRTVDGAVDIHHIDVAVSYVVTTNIEYLAIYTYCYLEVVTAVNDVQHDDVVHTVAEHQMGSPNSDLSGTFEATYLMSDLLPDSAIDQYGELHGWKMSFNARVWTILDLADGTQREAEDTCGIALILVWFEPEPAEEPVFKVESYIVLP